MGKLLDSNVQSLGNLMQTIVKKIRHNFKECQSI